MSSMRVTVEDIGRLYRRGSDIDLEAIFGGHISGKRSQNGKVNPVFLESTLFAGKKADNKFGKKGDNLQSKLNGKIISAPSSGIEIEIYNSIPEQKLKYHESTTVNMGDEGENHENSQEANSIMDASRQERESLKVTNGEVFVGDIVIENGYKNPAFDSESEVLYDVIKDVSNCDTDSKIQTSVDTEDRVNNVSDLQGNVLNHTDGIVISCSALKTANQTDWPEIEELVLPDVDYNQNQKETNSVKQTTDGTHSSEIKGYNQVFVVSGKQLTENGKTHQNSFNAVEQVKNDKNSPKIIKNDKNLVSNDTLHNSEKKLHKSILVTSISLEENGDDHEHKKPNGSVLEHKSVKFTEDTIDNEEKPKKYKKEKIFMSNIYRGKICNDNAVAKQNPVFYDDGELERSLTDDEKAARYSFRKIRDVDSQYGGKLNIPAYMQEYVINATGQMTSVPLAQNDMKLKMDGEIETLDEVPAGYDKLIKRTVAKERRNKIIRLALAVFAFLVVIAAVVLIVVFLGKPKS